MRRPASSKTPPFERLLTRAEFVAAAKGARSNMDAFGLQGRRRTDAPDTPARFGLTVTKKTAPRAVDRNRIRRRLREALRLGAALSGEPGHDYVIVGRAKLLRMPFADLRIALTDGLGRVTRQSAGRRANKVTKGPKPVSTHQ